MDVFFEIHKDLPREGPGDKASTLKALGMVQNLPAIPLILDMGCGPGLQTLTLAQNSVSKIIALDNHSPFLSQLRISAQTQGLSARIQPLIGSMFNPPFPQQQFDLIWCEGAIYIIGVEEGAKTWQALLKPGGSLAVTEISWIRPDPPAEVLAYWMAEYPGMRSVEQNLQTLQAANYHVSGSFILPSGSWWKDYYTPIETKLPGLRAKYRDDPQALGCIEATQKEIDIYRHYSDWYGYVFYVAQTPEDR
jgi:SAM-dependent methyltransferase